MKVRWAALIAVLLPAMPSVSAESPASKNGQGNRLFYEGKYPEAEKLYLEAQADLPDRPELFFNLGNALIRQKKYDLGLQALQQAGSKGDRMLRAKSWFNAGNALFELGNFGDAAQAYAQSLRADSSDREAKHNLELALMKLQEQQKRPRQDQEQNQNKDQQQPGGQAPDPSEKERESGQKPQENRPADPKSSEADQREGSFTRERALQILDALQNQELLEQKKQLERLARRKVAGRDW
jgi:Ca-activated chloride channel family protein